LKAALLKQIIQRVKVIFSDVSGQIFCAEISVINCHNWLRYFPKGSRSRLLCGRSLKWLALR